MSTELMWTLVTAAAIVAASVVVGGWLSGVVASALTRTGLEASTRRLLAGLVRPLIVVIGTIAALQTLSLDLTSASLMLAAATLAVGLAMQGPLADAAAGTVLRARAPYEVDEQVRVGDHEGRVVEQRTFALVLELADGSLVRLPNRTVLSSAVQNFSRKGRRRITLQLDLEPTADASGVCRRLCDAAAALEGVLDEPAPTAEITDLSGPKLRIQLHAWTEGATHDAVRAALGLALLDALHGSVPLTVTQAG
ncbi:MAG: mechanosensitive ion channel family protein [Myxococcales bacterium]|nr:mechanosensitive ion channel family protein [Myxococcales bacterium]